MRLALAVISLLMAGCSTSRPALPEQPNAPTSEGIVTTVGKQWDTADQKVAASVSIARENADRPDIVRSETSVALSFLPPPEPGELALARARAAKADQKDYAQATAFGKTLLASIDKNWAKVEADNKEALRVSQLKDARIVELTKAVEQAKKDAAANIWTMAGVGIAALGAIAMVFAGPRIGATLLLSGGAIGAFPYVVDSEYFSYIAGSTLALAAGLGIYWLWDHVRDSANASNEQPKE
jgi:flagellar motility protein MotE (MotC chaperone)